MKIKLPSLFNLKAIKWLKLCYNNSNSRMQRFISKYKYSFFCSFFVCLNVMAQDIAIGQWRDHLPYNAGSEVAVAEKLIYCVADGNLFYLNSETNETFKCSKAEGFSDFGIASIAYDKLTKTLVIAYSNTNVDLIVDNKIVNISDIKRKPILGNKAINRITIKNGIAYLACGFGIVLIDLVRKEIKDTYYIGNLGSSINVNEIVFSNDSIYAATSLGIYKAAIANNFLSDYNSWKIENQFSNVRHNSLAIFKNKIFAIIDESSTISRVFYRDLNLNNWQLLDSTVPFKCTRLKARENEISAIYNGAIVNYNSSLIRFADYFGYGIGSLPNDIDIDGGSNLWIADKNNSLVKLVNGTSNFSWYRPQGPASNFVVDMDSKDGVLWTCPGGASGLNPGFRIASLSKFKDNEWTSMDGYYLYSKTGAYDLMAIRANPNNPEKAFVGSWGAGLLELKTDSILNHYTNSNSSLDTIPGSSQIRIQGLDYDKNGNLWIANSASPTSLAVFTKDKVWNSFKFNNYPNANVLKLLAASNGQKWVVVERTGVIVYDDAGTIDNPLDDRLKKLGFELGKGGIAGSDIFCLTEDLNGEIWMGTDKGVNVYYAPNTVFDENAAEVQQIKIDQGGYVQYLLESEKVTAIAVDDANRKWIGTANSGVYLMNSDGTKQLEHFTEENSPLISNGITALSIIKKTGEVFFGTEKGLISYKDVATTGYRECTDLLVYPNPVRENYNGVIAVRGLVQDAIVKFTDAQGSLVYETKAYGGQAIWDGLNSKGEKVSSGVYFAFSSNSDGSRGCTAKFVIIR